MTLELAEAADKSLVYSVMYTSWKGRLVRHSDLMIDEGQILTRLPDKDLGVKPSDPMIQQSVDEVIDFIAGCKDSIVRALPDVS